MAMNKLNIWRICVFHGTGDRKADHPSTIGYVRTRKCSQAVIFAQEALFDANQSVTVEIEAVEPDCAIHLDQSYQAKWTGEP
jgi:hypothetical protein